MNSDRDKINIIEGKFPDYWEDSQTDYDEILPIRYGTKAFIKMVLVDPPRRVYHRAIDWVWETFYLPKR